MLALLTVMLYVQEKVNQDVMKMRNLHIELLWNMTKALNVLHPDNWTSLAVQILDNYTREVYIATKMGGWDFEDLGEEKEFELQWSFTGALLYCITVITTIGVLAHWSSDGTLRVPFPVINC